MRQRDVWVTDSSALINMKRVVPAAKQWPLFERLTEFVREGTLFFPRQVADELGQARHVDTPEAWALGVGPRVTLAYDPDPDLTKRVMEVAGDVVEADAEKEKGDPYVLAQALELQRLGLSPHIVTDDVVDRLPIKIAMTTACQRLGLPFVTVDDFLRTILQTDLQG